MMSHQLTSPSEQLKAKDDATSDAQFPDTSHQQSNVDPDNGQRRELNTERALWGWLILCFSTGPVSGMLNSYVTASIQSVAVAVGHIPGTSEPCARRGSIHCVVMLGGNEVDYLSYLLYLRSISRAIEGVVSIITAGVADQSNFRKPMLIASIFLLGVLSLPFAGLTGDTYGRLNALSTLFVLITTTSGMYTVIEGSYIPIFMRSVPRLRECQDHSNHQILNGAWQKGSRVSVLGLVASNVGALIALLIGVIITYSKGSYVTEGYTNYLLAITIAGCLTIIVACFGYFLLPAIYGNKRQVGLSILVAPFIIWLRLLRSISKYPNAFKLCLGWVLWNTGYSNFLQLLGPLFLETTGIESGSGVYTVYTFMMVIFACIGSLSWLAALKITRFHIKSWAYIFLAVHILCILWGCLGISVHVPIGYKHQSEFWVATLLFMSTGSALRSLNRVLYASLIPMGSEALFFGLEITLDLATGWINPFVQGVIQNRTHNLRFPMIPNLLLVLAALGSYLWCDVCQGLEHAKIPMESRIEGRDIS